jgi:Bacterial Ig domain
MEMKKIPYRLLFPCLLALLTITPVFAQSAELVLRLSRNFGYSSGTGKIQGTFSMNATGPANLARVVFLIDNQPIGETTQAPFSIRFNTGDYPLGVHTLSATGYTTGGQVLKSNEYRQEFVSAQTGWQAAGKIALPIIGIVVLMMLFSYVLPVIAGRGKLAGLPLGASRNYGALGGGICPKCDRPFGFHFYGLNLLTGKFDRCPYCGKWSIIKRASQQELHVAEVAELENSKPNEVIPEISREEELRKQLDDSRYQDS